ncbi:MAG: formylglycine-generating enzyme family protein [Nitrospirota bacterium]|nr:formylglycine-generating enzyme family protein [Nitrospirota bacterium]
MKRLIALLCVLAAGCTTPSGMADATPAGMVLVPAGPFVMGTDKTDEGEASEHGLPYTWYSDATPRRTVELPAYYIDTFEMTNAEYLQFLNGTDLPVAPPHGWNDNRPPDGTNDEPVTGLNWYEAQFACLFFGKRLPSEAEWEKAARGPDGNLFPWGNTFDASRANVATGAEGGRKLPVGSLPAGASPYGVQDMIGNAWEWTRDWYAPYPGSTHKSENYGKRFKVIRGNSYGSPGHFPPDELEIVIRETSRANYRFSFDPKGRFRDSGVRCAKSVEMSTPQ